MDIKMEERYKLLGITDHSGTKHELLLGMSLVKQAIQSVHRLKEWALFAALVGPQQHKRGFLAITSF